MTLITTPADPNADSFASVAEYDAYLSARGIANTTVLADKENALRKGAAYLSNQYNGRWIGFKSLPTQSLPWPRYGDTPSPRTHGWSGFYGLFDLDGWPIATNIVPVAVKNAQIEATMMILAGSTLEPVLVRGGQIKSIGKSVGPLRKDIVYMDGAPVVDRYTAIEGILRGLVTSTPGASSGVVALVRG